MQNATDLLFGEIDLIVFITVMPEVRLSASHPLNLLVEDSAFSAGIIAAWWHGYSGLYSAQQLIFETSFVYDSAAILSASAMVG